LTLSTRPSVAELQKRCTSTRLAIMEEVEVAGSGHYGSSFSLVEILASLYYAFLRVRPSDPAWAERDRFILSKGHGVSALYPILADLGFFDSAHLATFTQLGSILGDHPDVKKVPGVDFSSGSLGHGLSAAAGMAEAVRLRGFDSRVVVILGDGEQDEGQVWEAAAFAAHRHLAGLLAITDRNAIQVDGPTSDILNLSPLAAKWQAFGWRVAEVDGHDLQALLDAYNSFDAYRLANPGGEPTMIIAGTVGGRGVPLIENQADWHLGYLHGPDRDAAIRQLRSMYNPGQDEGAS
jgi:transketolase